MTQLIRMAQLEDVGQMARVHMRSWQVTYRDVLAAEYLAAIDVNNWADRWRDRINASQPGDATLILQEQDNIMGFISVGAAEGSEGRDEGELRAIYLDPEHTGRGLGVLLHDAGLSALRKAGFKSAILWVGVENRQARSFYERNGWTATGEPATKSVAGAKMSVQRFERSLG